MPLSYLLACSHQLHTAPLNLQLIPASEGSERLLCRARGTVVLNSDGSRLDSSFRMNFELMGVHSKLTLQLLNPLGLTEAYVTIDGSEKLMRHGGETEDLMRYSIFRYWHDEFWWEGLSFSLGFPTRHSRGQTWQDLNTGETVLYKRSEREIECHLESGDRRHCEIRDPHLKGTINFSFLECKELVSL